MLTHKTFTAQALGLTGKDSLTKREKIREKVEQFINSEIKPEKVVGITEFGMSIGAQFTVTVWYRKN